MRVYKYDRAVVKQIMVTELGYEPFDADQVLNTIPILHDQLREPMEQWIIDRRVIDTGAAGLTLEGIMERRQCNFVVAIRYLNMLLSDDLPADRRRSIISMLQRPFQPE